MHTSYEYVVVACGLIWESPSATFYRFVATSFFVFVRLIIFFTLASRPYCCCCCCCLPAFSLSKLFNAKETFDGELSAIARQGSGSACRRYGLVPGSRGLFFCRWMGAGPINAGRIRHAQRSHVTPVACVSFPRGSPQIRSGICPNLNSYFHEETYSSNNEYLVLR